MLLQLLWATRWEYPCANRGLAGDAFTLAYKTLPGVKTDDLSESQVTHVCGSYESTGHNGNVYITRGEEYDVLQQGYMADGTSFDEVLYLDMLKSRGLRCLAHNPCL